KTQGISTTTIPQETGNERNGEELSPPYNETVKETVNSNVTSYLTGIVLLSSGTANLFRGNKYKWFSIFIAGFYVTVKPQNNLKEAKTPARTKISVPIFVDNANIDNENPPIAPTRILPVGHKHTKNIPTKDPIPVHNIKYIKRNVELGFATS
ncbi:7266_t:CDS:2, partial [Entrophospora sp. SA101]